MNARSMPPEDLRRKFHGIGARLAVTEWTRDSRPFFRIGIQQTGRFERFEISCSNVSIDIGDIDLGRHQLLLLARWTKADGGTDDTRYLCGFDERHWFAAQVPVAPDGAPLTIDAAHEALKPAAARASQAERRVPRALLNERRNPGFIRQGEWFFIPRPELLFDIRRAQHNAELRRGLGKPHVVQYLIGVPEQSWRFPWESSDAKHDVYARGKIRHRDHRTIRLPFWHQVELSEEVPSSNWGID